MSKMSAKKPFPFRGRAFLHATCYYTIKGFFAQLVENMVNKTAGVVKSDG